MLNSEDMLEITKLILPEGAKAWEMTADELDEEATRRFLDHGNLDALGWQHKYQAMNLRNYAKVLRAKAEENK